jgi:hypothetical protein
VAQFIFKFKRQYDVYFSAWEKKGLQKKILKEIKTVLQTEIVSQSLLQIHTLSQEIFNLPICAPRKFELLCSPGCQYLKSFVVVSKLHHSR